MKESIVDDGMKYISFLYSLSCKITWDNLKKQLKS